MVRKRSRRESSSSERDDEYMSAKEQTKERERRIVLKRGRKAKNITPERWMNENFEVQYSSVQKRAPGVYILGLEKAEDREKILEESKSLEKWEEYYVEKWLSMEEWIEKQKEKGDRARKQK